MCQDGDGKVIWAFVSLGNDSQLNGRGRRRRKGRRIVGEFQKYRIKHRRSEIPRFLKYRYSAKWSFFLQTERLCFPKNKTGLSNTFFRISMYSKSKKLNVWYYNIIITVYINRNRINGKNGKMVKCCWTPFPSTKIYFYGLNEQITGPRVTT